MEDYNFHCFQASWETEPFFKAGLPVHGASHTLTVSVPSSQWRRDAPHDNGNTIGECGHHFLDACGRCGRLLGRNKDIFMYRGNTPFCSEECRQQEMNADEAKERRRSSKQPAATAAANSGAEAAAVEQRFTDDSGLGTLDRVLSTATTRRQRNTRDNEHAEMGWPPGFVWNFPH